MTELKRKARQIKSLNELETKLDQIREIMADEGYVCDEVYDAVTILNKLRSEIIEELITAVMEYDG